MATQLDGKIDFKNVKSMLWKLQFIVHGYVREVYDSVLCSDAVFPKLIPVIILSYFGFAERFKFRSMSSHLALNQERMKLCNLDNADGTVFGNIRIHRDMPFIFIWKFHLFVANGGTVIGISNTHHKELECSFTAHKSASHKFYAINDDGDICTHNGRQFGQLPDLNQGTDVTMELNVQKQSLRYYTQKKLYHSFNSIEFVNDTPYKLAVSLGYERERIQLIDFEQIIIS